MKKLQIITILLITFSAINTNAQTQGAGYALDFDGSNDYVVANNVSSILSSSTEFTMSVWCYQYAKTGGHDRKIILAFNNPEGTGSNSNRSLILYDYSNNKYAYGDEHTTSVHEYTNNTYAINKWHFITLTIDVSDNANLYINGILDLSFSTDSRPVNNGQFSIGQEWDAGTPSQFFAGKLDEIRIWNRALSQTEIRNNMNKQLTGSEPGLVAYYQMNEGENGTCEDGKDVCDKSGNGNHGTKN